MRIESIGIMTQNYKIEANTGIDYNESFSEMIDELSDEMSKSDLGTEQKI